MSTRVRELERRTTVLAFALLVLAVGWLTLAITSAASATLVTWWPAVGIACTLVVRTPGRWWWWTVPLVASANLVANLLHDRPVLMAAALSVLVGVEAVVFALVMRWRAGGIAVLSDQLDFLRLVGAATLAAGSGGVLAAALLPATAAEQGAREYLLTVVTSHGAAILVIAPVLMSLRRPLLPIQTWELVLQTGALMVTAVGVFFLTDLLALTFVPIPFLAWAAFRFGLRMVAVQLVLVAVVTSVATTRGLGPFAVQAAPASMDNLEAASLVQTFMICLALLCVPLALSVEQSLRLTERLQASSDLFHRNFAESLVAMLVLRVEHGDLVVHDANQLTTTLLDLEHEQVVGRRLGDLLRTDEPLEDVAEELGRGRRTRWRGEGRMRHSQRQVLLSLARLSGSDREPMVNAQLLDLTTERAARADLDAERQLTDLTLATTACLIVVSDLEGTLLRVNPALGRLLGVDHQELVGRRTWDVLVPAEHREVTRRMFSGTGYREIPDSVESVVLDVHGRQHRVAWTSAIADDHAGNPSYVVMTGLDITAELDAAGMTQHLLAAAQDTALIGMDLEGSITLFNAGAEQLLGTTSFEAVGRPFADLLVPEELVAWAAEREAPPTFATLRDALVDEDAQDWTWRRADGSGALVSMSLTRVTDHGGSLIGYLCVGRDVSQARQSQEMLVTALEKERTVVERLRHLDAAKDEFVSTVSHELRTPVASIVGYTELLQDGDFGAVPDEQVPVVDAINRNAARLVNLVDNLLALNSLTEKTPSWERARVDLVDLLGSLERTTVASEAAQRLQLCFRTPAEPVLVDGDRSQLERALGNLLSNALKFTEARGHVGCTLAVEDGTAVVTVTDSGLGIPEEEQQHLFTRFWRSSTAQARHIQGTGLGLSIAQTIVTAHGGTVTVESEHLKGTTVTVRLPVSPG